MMPTSLLRALAGSLPVCLAACTGATLPPAAGPATAPSTAATRPIPYPVMETPAFARAVASGTRSRDGTPGPRYWQQHATYRLRASLDPATATLSGTGAIRYENRSPDTLDIVYLHLRPNLFSPEAIRNEVVPITDGLRLGTLKVNGSPIGSVRWRDSTRAGHAIDGTTMRVRLPRPLAPGGALDLEVEWSYVVPPDGAPRGGHDADVWMISYWYPQMAVYDDVNGWQRDPYMGNAEFYMGYGDYDVSLTVPEGWLVAATGTLENAAEMAGAGAVALLDSARRTGRVTRIAAANDGGSRRTRTWRWTARGVRDFAWAASVRYVWDAVPVVVGDATGDNSPDTAMAYTFYRPGRRNWQHSAEYARHSVDFLSRLLWPYPYPQMTVIDGVDSCSGMEYPMITCIGRERDTLDLYGVIVHEIAHMWFPMQVGSDEKRHSWQDEGLTRYNQSLAMEEYFRGYDRFETSRRNYYRIAGSGDEVEAMRHGDLYPPRTNAFGVASYDKTSLTLRMLRSMLGDDVFLRAYREYGRAWRDRHPTPFDMFNAFEREAGRDLDWFWRTWFFETWTLDQAIGSVSAEGDSTLIALEDRGLAPMPVRLAATLENGEVRRIEVPVDVWLSGARRHVVVIPGRAARVEIDPDQLWIDVDRTNNVWTR